MVRIETILYTIGVINPVKIISMQPALTTDTAKIRNCLKSDLHALLAIEQSVHIIPWTEETFKICFQSGYSGWVVEKNAEIIGFIIVSLTPEECHVLNLCIANPHQHQGWGRRLLEHTFAQAKMVGTGIIFLEVRKSNIRAISLYRKLQFHLVGERKAYYPSPAGNEDALVFAKSLHDIPLA